MILLLFAGSCKCPKQATETGPTQDTGEVLTPLLVDDYGGREEEGLEVIRSAKDMQALFARINRTRKPGLPVPEVDFQSRQVIVYFPGKGKHDAKEIDLVRTQSADGVVLQARKRKTAKSEDSAAIVAPVLIYTMARTEGSVSLAE